MIKIFKQIAKWFILQNEILAKQLELLTEKIKYTDVKQRWNLETGEKFNELVNRYPISEDELLNMCETVCKFVQYTRITNIDKYLFVDGDFDKPLLPYMLKDRR